MSKKKIIIISIAVLAVIAIVVSLSTKGGSEVGVAVETTTVENQKIVETVTATGRIQPKTQVKISADVAAKITRLDIKEGEWVEKGQFLVQLDKERFEASVESAQANLRSIEANALLVKENMLKTEKDYNRTKGLFSKNLESQAVLDQVHAAYKVEKARYESTLQQVAQANAALKQSRDDLSKTTIYSPMAGTISKLNKEVGEIALGSQFQEDVIMIVSNLSGMEALVNVDENDIVSVHIGDSAKIEVDALPDMVFKGIVSEIANSANISSVGTADQKTEFEVKISINTPGEKLRPGMTSSADIVTKTKMSTMVVPIQSVAVRTPEQLKSVAIDNSETEADSSSTKAEFTPDKDGFIQILFVVNDDVVEAKQIKTGIQSETHIEIVEGISLGNVIVTGNYRAISQILKPGSKVAVKKNRK